MSQKIKNIFISIGSSKKALYAIMAVVILAIVIPVLATYTGPNRTTTEKVCVDIQVVDYCTYKATISSYVINTIGDDYIKTGTTQCTVTSNGCEPNVSVSTWKNNCFSFIPEAISIDSNVVRTEITHPEEQCHNETVAAPPATVNGSVSCTNGTNGWCRSDATLNISGSDPNPANTIIAIEGTRNGTDFACASDTCQIDATSNGSFAFEYWAVSSYGDTSYKGNTTITVDKEAPVVGLNLSGSMGYNSWYVSGVSWTTSLTDSVSGPSHVNVSVDGTAQSNPGSYAADGTHTIKATGYDNAGNSSQTQQIVQIDQTNPIPAYTLNGSLGTNGWYTSAVNWNASATDATSGVYAVATQLDGASVNNSASIGTNGTHTLQVTAQDNAGNMNSTSGSFKIDQEAPFVSLNLSGTQGTHSWYTGSVSWSSTASDTVSGLASHTATLNGSTTTVNGSVNSDGTYTLIATAQDNASNQSTQIQSFGIDQSAPTVSMNPISGTQNNTVQLSGNSTDVTSGVSYVEISIAGQTHQVNTTGAWSYQWNSTSACNGSVTASVRSVDQSGNVSPSTTQTFTVQNTPTTLTLPAQTDASNPVVFNLNTSNLNQMVIRISDDAGNLPAVTHTFTGTSIPSSYRWDRYMGDGSLAPKGTYTMNVRIYDKNTCTTDTASITLVVTESILSAWVSGALTSGELTNTPMPAQPTATPLPLLTPTIESTETEVAILPATGNDTETPTSTPTTILNPNPFVLPKADQKTTTSTSSSPKASNSITDPIPAPTTLSTGVLIGTAAAGLIGSIAAYQAAVEAERKRKEAEAKKQAEELTKLRTKLAKNGEDWHGLGMDQMKQKVAQIDAINKANEEAMYQSVIASGGDPNMSLEEAVAIFTNASARKEKEAVYKNQLNETYGGVLSESIINSYAEALSYGTITVQEVLEKVNNILNQQQLGLANVGVVDNDTQAYMDEWKDAQEQKYFDNIAANDAEIINQYKQTQRETINQKVIEEAKSIEQKTEQKKGTASKNNDSNFINSFVTWISGAHEADASENRSGKASIATEEVSRGNNNENKGSGFLCNLFPGLPWCKEVKTETTPISTQELPTVAPTIITSTPGLTATPEISKISSNEFVNYLVNSNISIEDLKNSEGTRDSSCVVLAILQIQYVLGIDIINFGDMAEADIPTYEEILQYSEEDLKTFLSNIDIYKNDSILKTTALEKILLATNQFETYQEDLTVYQEDGMVDYYQVASEYDIEPGDDFKDFRIEHDWSDYLLSIQGNMSVNDLIFYRDREYSGGDGETSSHVAVIIGFETQIIDETEVQVPIILELDGPEVDNPNIITSPRVFNAYCSDYVDLVTIYHYIGD